MIDLVAHASALGDVSQEMPNPHVLATAGCARGPSPDARRLAWEGSSRPSETQRPGVADVLREFGTVVGARPPGI